jgi:hypothetical protein
LQAVLASLESGEISFTTVLRPVERAAKPVVSPCPLHWHKRDDAPRLATSRSASSFALVIVVSFSMIVPTRSSLTFATRREMLRMREREEERQFFCMGTP